LAGSSSEGNGPELEGSPSATKFKLGKSISNLTAEKQCLIGGLPTNAGAREPPKVPFSYPFHIATKNLKALVSRRKSNGTMGRDEGPVSIPVPPWNEKPEGAREPPKVLSPSPFHRSTGKLKALVRRRKAKGRCDTKEGPVSVPVPNSNEKPEGAREPPKVPFSYPFHIATKNLKALVSRRKSNGTMGRDESPGAIPVHESPE